jgi:AcrR family transcriptional regulator
MKEKAAYHHGDLKNALIQAGIDILSKEGVEGLTLRKAARVAGVSHAAPYAHFTDKQALIAAISTEGYRRFYEKLSAAVSAYPDEPLRQLLEGAWDYMKFALDDPAHFHITFSGAVEREKDYPELVEATEVSFRLVVQIVTRCQQAGFLNPEPPDLMAVGIWSAVHGLACLRVNGQISHTVLERFSERQLMEHTLNQFIRAAP